MSERCTCRAVSNEYPYHERGCALRNENDAIMLKAHGHSQKRREKRSDRCEHGGYRSLCPECSDLR